MVIGPVSAASAATAARAKQATVQSRRVLNMVRVPLDKGVAGSGWASAVDIGAAVAQKRVEGVQVLAAGGGEVDHRSKGFGLVPACGAGERPAAWADDQALSFEGLSAL